MMTNKSKKTAAFILACCMITNFYAGRNSAVLSVNEAKAVSDETEFTNTPVTTYEDNFTPVFSVHGTVWIPTTSHEETTASAVTEPPVTGFSVPENALTTIPPLENPLPVAYPAEGKFSTEIWIADSSTGFVIFGAECRLYKMKNGERVREIASWNTTEEPGKIFSDLDYFFEKESDEAEYEVVIENMISRSDSQPAAASIKFSPYFLMDNIYASHGVIFLPLSGYIMENDGKDPFSNETFVSSVPAVTEPAVTYSQPVTSIPVSEIPDGNHISAVYGDTDGNGIVTASDLIKLIKFLQAADNSLNTENADLNRDGVINIIDLIKLKQILFY